MAVKVVSLGYKLKNDTII